MTPGVFLRRLGRLGKRAPGWTGGAGIAATLASVYALLAAFAWALEGDVGWSAWPRGQYVLNGLAILGLFIAPVAVVLGWRFSFHSWRWGFWLTWPQILLGFSLHRGCPIAPPCASADLEPTLMPALLLALSCSAAWLGTTARRRLVERPSQQWKARSTPQREPLDHDRSRARVVVLVSFAALMAAFQIQPRSVPILLVSGVGLVYGLWLLVGRGREAGRMWGVLAAGLIGGVLGFVALIDLTWSASNERWDGLAVGYLSMAARIWPFAVASGLLFALAWPEWWWRWGLILSWGFILAGVTAFHASLVSSSMPELFVSRAPLLLVPIPFLAAAVGAFVRGAFPLKPPALRDSGV